MSDKPEALTEEEFMEIDGQLTSDYNKKVETDAKIRENTEITADIRNKELKIKRAEMNRITGIKDSLLNEDITERAFDKNSMLKSVEDRKNSIIFLNKKISQHIITAPGSLVTIASMTNNGKSTLTAHITEAIITKEDKPVVILSNEETEDDVRARVSCLRSGISFGDYKSNKCTDEQVENVLQDAELLAVTKKLIVVSSKNENDAYRVTTVDGVISTMKSVDGKVGAVILDYYQNVNMSEFGSIEPWHVNNKLSSELNVIKGMMKYPIIVFAQCKGITTDKKITDKGALDYESNHPMYRWKGGQNLLTYSTDIIELVKDFDNSCSVLYAHKVRFGHGDLKKQHIMPFDKKMQRFVKWSAEFDAKVTSDKVKRTRDGSTSESGLGGIFEKND